MRKLIYFLGAMLLLSNIATAQTIEKKWGFGAGAGGYLNLTNSSLGFTPEAYLSRYISPSFDVMADLMIGYFGNKNINEPLDLLNPSLNLRYKLYNGYIMPVESKFQPYIKGGIGYLFDNAQTGVNFNLGGGVKYPLNKTFSLFAEASYISGIPSQREQPDGTIVDIQDNFMKLVAGFEISFIKQPDTDKDGVIDPIDQCPDTPKGATVDEVGCPTDSDGDGVYDGIDKCPNTFPGTPVDEKGCPLDDDGDGVYNNKDKCPDTPKRVEVDEDGCPLDEDNDGVYDQDDKCPGTPEGVKVDKNGCPFDDDNDGVINENDKCPDTPKGAKVDEFGCIDHKAIIDFINEQLHPIYYATDADAVTAEQYEKIDHIIEMLDKYPEYKVNLYGHADPRGTETYNKALSQRRVDGVVQLLEEKGVDMTRITTRAFGEDMAKNEADMTEEELQEERKVASYMYFVFEE